MTAKAAQPTKPTRILHPILLALYPALALLAANIHEIEPGEGMRALLVSALLGLAVWGLAHLAINDPLKAAMAASLVVLFFFAYGHVYTLLQSVNIGGIALGRHRFLGPIWGMLLVLGLQRVQTGVRDLVRMTRTLNLVSALLLGFSVSQLVFSEVQDFFLEIQQASDPAALESIRLPADFPAPDIYYIVLDGYSRDDLLLKRYHLDITPFLEEMRDLGFYYAQCGQSNYAQTKMSLSATLNMDYIENFFPDAAAGASSSHGLEPYLLNSAVRQNLEQLGYRTVAFETGFIWTEMKDANIFLSPGDELKDSAKWLRGLNGFEVLLLDSTASRLVRNLLTVFGQRFEGEIGNPELTQRERTLFVLDKLDEFAESRTPQFIFAHIVSPHSPFVFDTEGDIPAPGGEERDLYAQQTAYLNKRIRETVGSILSEAETPPIIIIQSDHGVGLASPADRMHNLGLYFLPHGGERLLYPQITPVNVFRIIFRHYFGVEMPLLEDQSFFSTYGAPFDYQLIPNSRLDCTAGE